MKILCTADARIEVWSYVTELVRGLQPHGVEVHLAVMGPPLNAEQRAQLDDCPHVTLYENRAKLEWMEDPWADLGEAGNWLLRIEDRLRPELVHLNQYVPAALPWHAPRIVTGHGCQLSRWLAVKSDPIPERFRRYRDEVRRGLQAANLLVVPTRAMVRDLQPQYDPLPPVQVVPHGRSPSAFCGGIKEPFVFTVGQVWDEARNIMALAKAAPNVSWPIYVAGEQDCPEPGGPAGYQQLRCLGTLTGEAISTWLARAAVFALPARYDPLGLSAIEAGLARCALVLGDIPSLRETWRDAALFVPPDDADALAAALQSLINDGNRRNDLAVRAHNRASKFPAETMASAYHSTYQNLVIALQQR